MKRTAILLASPIFACFCMSATTLIASSSQAQPQDAAATMVRAMQPIETDPVSTRAGAIKGTSLPSGIRAYLGIPFAAPPVDKRRWAAPQPASWTGILNAARTGAECIQVLRPHDINHYFGEEPTSENCLFMNIWAPPAKAGAKLPVVVFIYGGGFTIGSSGMPNYGGEAMAQRGAVFVNFNYRVGALGFMAHPELSREQGGHSGNYGLMDQMAALRWVRENIAAFGGDPEQVTIIGQSAGAGSVASLIFSPQAKGLFRSATMASSCSYRAPLPTLGDAEATGLAVQKRLNAPSMEAMRNIPADRILAIQSESQLGANVEGIRIGGPIIDGHVLPDQKPALLAAGKINLVPIIASSNTDDIDISMSPFGKLKTLDQYRATAAAAYGDKAAEFLKRFPASSDAQARDMARHVAHLAGFELASRQCAVDQASVGQKTYVAQFSRKHPYTPGVRFADHDPVTIGAYHTGDMPYWFGTLDVYNARRQTRDWTPYDRKLSATMMDHLIAFARDGAPGAGWQAWTARNQTQRHFGDTVTQQALERSSLDWLEANRIAPTARPSRSTSPQD
jgi:para-nitrobenzyl esterase